MCTYVNICVKHFLRSLVIFISASNCLASLCGLWMPFTCYYQVKYKNIEDYAETERRERMKRQEFHKIRNLVLNLCFIDLAFSTAYGWFRENPAFGGVIFIAFPLSFSLPLFLSPTSINRSQFHAIVWQPNSFMHAYLPSLCILLTNFKRHFEVYFSKMLFATTLSYSGAVMYDSIGVEYFTYSQKLKIIYTLADTNSYLLYCLHSGANCILFAETKCLNGCENFYLPSHTNMCTQRSWIVHENQEDETAS